MTSRARIARLEEIGKLLLEVKLAELHRAAEARRRSLEQLEALAMRPAADLDPVTAAQTELRYQRWAEARRAEIDRLLARQTADWMKAQCAARQAFGKTEALRLLRDRLR